MYSIENHRTKVQKKAQRGKKTQKSLPLMLFNHIPRSNYFTIQVFLVILHHAIYYPWKFRVYHLLPTFSLYFYPIMIFQSKRKFLLLLIACVCTCFTCIVYAQESEYSERPIVPGHPMWVYTASNKTLTLYYAEEAPQTINDEAVTAVTPYKPNEEAIKNDPYRAVAEHIVVDPSVEGWLPDTLDYLFAYLPKVKHMEIPQEFAMNTAQTMRGMFKHNTRLEGLTLGIYDFEQLHDIDSLFAHCIFLQRLDFHFWMPDLNTAKGVFHNNHSLRYVNMIGSDTTDDLLKEIALSRPNPFTLCYLRSKIEGSSLERVTGRNIISSNGLDVGQCSEYYLSDNIMSSDDLERGEYPAPNTDVAMRWPIEIPIGFTAKKVINDRKVGSKIGHAYSWFMPYEFVPPNGVSAYQYSETSVDGDTVTFIPAEAEWWGLALYPKTPYILVSSIGEFSTSILPEEGIDNASINVAACLPDEDIDAGYTSGGWNFVGSFKWRTAAEAANEGLWTLQSNNYWKTYQGSKARPRPMRAFMKQMTPNARPITMHLENPTLTGVKRIQLLDKANPENSRIYDLNGNYLGTRRETLSKGIYIIDGKTTAIP